MPFAEADRRSAPPVLGAIGQQLPRPARARGFLSFLPAVSDPFQSYILQAFLREPP
jgi:hypothetical protein